MENMVDMAMDESEMKENLGIPSACSNKYPYGLCIRLGQPELDKLKMDGDVDAGDMIDLRGFGKVTSVSKQDTPDGQKCYVEIQLMYLKCENEEHEEPEPYKPKNPYQKKMIGGLFDCILFHHLDF